MLSTANSSRSQPSWLAMPMAVGTPPRPRPAQRVYQIVSIGLSALLMSLVSYGGVNHRLQKLTSAAAIGSARARAAASMQPREDAGRSTRRNRNPDRGSRTGEGNPSVGGT